MNYIKGYCRAVRAEMQIIWKVNANYLYVCLYSPEIFTGSPYGSALSLAWQKAKFFAALLRVILVGLVPPPACDLALSEATGE